MFLHCSYEEAKENSIRYDYVCLCIAETPHACLKQARSLFPVPVKETPMLAVHAAMSAPESSGTPDPIFHLALILEVQRGCAMPESTFPAERGGRKEGPKRCASQLSHLLHTAFLKDHLTPST